MHFDPQTQAVRGNRGPEKITEVRNRPTECGLRSIINDLQLDNDTVLGPMPYLETPHKVTSGTEILV